MDKNYPEFKYGCSRFDQNTYKGRIRHFLEITDPRSLFTSKEKLEYSIKLLDNYKSKKLDGYNITNIDLWKAQKIKQAITHPDTGKKILMPFRMSGFVPFGCPIVIGLMLPNPSIRQVIFFQWMNQTNNACVNYSNRNATQETNTLRFILGYFGAASCAVAISASITILIKRSSGLSLAMKLIVQKFVPIPAIASANCVNVFLMRNNELFTGINVYDSDNRVVGVSKVAAKKAIKETAFSRMCLPVPIYSIPAMCLIYLERTRLLINFPKLHLPFNAVITTLTFACALPLALAIFPQTSSILTTKLEEEIQLSTTETVLFYNKGL